MQSEEDCIVVHLTELTKTGDDFPSKFGGCPDWLQQPNINSIVCQCKQQLTFLCQLYAPLDLQQSYHRAIYVFFCVKCSTLGKGFKVFRMQLPQSPINVVNKADICQTMPEEYSISTEAMSGSDYQQIIKKSNKVAEQQAEPDDDYVEVDDDEEWENDKVPNQPEEDMGELQKIKVNNQSPPDPIFQTYKKVVAQLNYPVILYYSEPLPFKKGDLLKKQKKCQNCGGQFRHEFQINSTIMSKFQRLVTADWSALYILTCRNSCKSPNKLIPEEYEAQLQDDESNYSVELKKQLERIENDQRKKELKKEKRKQKKKQKKEKETAEQATQEPDGDKKELTKQQMKNEEGDWD